jgi:deazaflavin-dependent oxidoreductase (nitroreductase family)
MTSARAAHPTGIHELLRQLARITAPLSRPLAGRRFFPLWAVVHHRGRRSGRAYATPVAIRATGEGFVIPLPWGTATDWFRNVQAAGGCTVRWKGSDHEATDPLLTDAADALSAFNRVQRPLMRFARIDEFLVVRRAQPGADTDRAT